MSLLNFKWSYRSLSFEYRKLFIRIGVSTSYYRASHSNVFDVNGGFELHRDSQPSEKFFLMFEFRGVSIYLAHLTLSQNSRASKEVLTPMMEHEVIRAVHLNQFRIVDLLSWDNYWFSNIFSSFHPLNDSNLIFLILPTNLNLTRFEMINNAAVPNPLLLSAQHVEVEFVWIFSTPRKTQSPPHQTSIR